MFCYNSQFLISEPLLLIFWWCFQTYINENIYVLLPKPNFLGKC